MSENKRTAIVTGGSSGIGRAVCIELAKKGVSVAVNYYPGTEAAAEETAKMCRELGAEAIIVEGDISKMEDCEALFEKTMEQFGRVDILVNNAGITRDGLILRMEEEDFDRVIATNLKGAFLCMKLASKIMMKQRYGRIVSLSSVVALMGNAGQVNYAASKAGIIGMTKSLAKEMAARGITVNAIAPGFIETDMTKVLSDEVKAKMMEGIPQKRLGQPEDVARAIAFLTDEQSGYITGQVLAVDGGMAM